MRLLNNDTLVITLQDWLNAGLSYDSYKNARKRKQIESTRACKGKPVEIYFDSIPNAYKEVIIRVLGDPRVKSDQTTFRSYIVPDEKAVTFFSNYKLSDGRHLSADHIKEYCINANVLNAVETLFKIQSNARKALSSTMQGFWSRALASCESVRAELKHTLPKNEVALKRKYQKYTEAGYSALINGRFGNDNSRKVSTDIERLIMSLYVMENKPFAADVHVLYTLFLSGSIQVVDKKTGELFNPQDFIKNDAPIEISESTVWNYLNLPHNRIIVDSKRSGSFNFNNEHRPHHHRNAPNYAFSKISMDDRDLPRKLNDGKRVKAYYAYDVASGCVVGRAYSRSKDEALFIDCIQDMFRMIDREGLPMPLEVEVENHLVNKFFDDLSLMFPFIRICNPGNSQEKHAEHLNKAKKYGIEHKAHTGIGRWYLSEAYRVDNDKVNDEFVQKTYSYETLVADDIQDCINFNNQLHPKQKKYPGKTRWQVLLENINPKAPAVSKPVVYKGIGDMVKTTINRNMYCTVKHVKFQLPTPAVISRLLPGNYEVEAYYLPDNNGIINEVFLYQNNVFLCRCEPVENYNTSKAEWETKDAEGYKSQAAFVSQFDKAVKEGKEELASISIIKTDSLDTAISQEAKTVTIQEQPDADIEAILKNYNPQDWSDKANEQI